MYNIYNICLSDNVTLEVPAESEKEALRIALYPTNVIGIYAIPVTKETQLNEEELEYTHAIGNITYIIHHMVDSDGCYYTVTIGEANERMDEIDSESMADIRIKLEKPLDFGYNTIEEAKEAIDDAIDEANDIYNEAIKY